MGEVLWDRALMSVDCGVARARLWGSGGAFLLNLQQCGDSAKHSHSQRNGAIKWLNSKRQWGGGGQVHRSAVSR